MQRRPIWSTRKTQLHHRHPATSSAPASCAAPAVVRQDQEDPGPEDKHHSNQHAVNLGFPSIHRRIAGFPESIFRDLGSPVENLARRDWPKGIRFYTSRLRASRTTASIEPLASLIRLSIITSLQGGGGCFVWLLERFWEL